MASYTTLVNIDTDPANLIKDIAGQLAEGDRASFEEKARQLVAAGSAGDLVLEFLKHMDVILAIEGDDRVQGFFEGIFSVIYTLTEHSQESDKLIKDIVEKITANKTSETERRLTALVVLLNLTFEVPSKLEAIHAIFTYAMETGLIDRVSHFQSRINDWIITWKLTAEQQRKLLRIASQALMHGNSSAQAQALRLNIRYFQTFKNEAISPEVDNLMKNSVISAINSPVDAFSDRCALLEAFHGLRLNQQWSHLVQLLKIICDGSLDDFLSFKSIHRATLVENKLDEAVLEQNIRLLTIASLAANSSNRLVSFQSISAALKVPEDEVEMWVIEAIAQNLINGSIDQVNSSVTITHFVHRSFGANQWKQLQQRLRELRKSVVPVVAAINSTNPSTKSAV